MKIKSPVFSEGEHIPDEYTMYGDNHIPPLQISEVPTRARSLALIMEDLMRPTALSPHWLLFNVDPRTTKLDASALPPGAVQGLNDYGETSYGGPKPPSGEHRYFFRFYALDDVLKLPAGINRKQLEVQIRAHAIDEGVLMGTYAHN